MNETWSSACTKDETKVIFKVKEYILTYLEIKGNPVIRLLFRLIVEAHLF